jgi:hypothetical protein
MRSFPYEVIAPPTISGTVNITVRVPVPEGVPAAEVITFVRSHTLKQDLMADWLRKNAPNHGLEGKGGPRPLLEDATDRGSKILAYEQDYRLGQRI